MEPGFIFCSYAETVWCWLIKLWPEKLCLSLFSADKCRRLLSKVKMEKQKMFSLKFITKFACRAQRRKKWFKRIIQWMLCNHINRWDRFGLKWNENMVANCNHQRMNYISQSFNVKLIKLTNNLEFEVEPQVQLKKI